MKMRSEEEVNEAEKRAFDIAWWKHDGMIIEKSGYSGNSDARARIEREIGMEDLEETLSDFGYGMIMGRLETMRWVQGFNWGFLDT